MAAGSRLLEHPGSVTSSALHRFSGCNPPHAPAHLMSCSEPSMRSIFAWCAPSPSAGSGRPRSAWLTASDVATTTACCSGASAHVHVKFSPLTSQACSSCTATSSQHPPGCARAPPLPRPAAAPWPAQLPAQQSLPPLAGTQSSAPRRSQSCSSRSMHGAAWVESSAKGAGGPALGLPHPQGIHH